MEVLAWKNGVPIALAIVEDRTELNMDDLAKMRFERANDADKPFIRAVACLAPYLQAESEMNAVDRGILWITPNLTTPTLAKNAA